MMRLFCVFLCVLAWLTIGCGNGEKTTEPQTEKSYSEELGRNIGEGINDIKQSAKDAVDASQKRLDEAKDAGME